MPSRSLLRSEGAALRRVVDAVTTLIAIDPGASTGWAVYGVDRSLIACGQIDGDRPDLLSLSTFAPGAILVIERPCDRPGKRKGDVNDLIALAIRAGSIQGRLLQIGATETRWYRPDEWKGQLPKDVCHQRAVEELAPWEWGRTNGPSGLDKWDAISLGLVACGRLKKGMLPLDLVSGHS
jgi:hypothetical protein